MSCMNMYVHQQPHNNAFTCLCVTYISSRSTQNELNKRNYLGLSLAY